MEKYQKVRVLGKGSFGSAILIKRKADDALFVVKEVSLQKMSKKEREEARHECTVLQQLQHPNIVRYVEQFENRNNLYIVMEYCDGGDLAEKVKQARGPMKESTVMYYFSQICLAMEYLHQRHIIHRDIKTMNVFLMKNGAVKLGDFGISTVLRNTMGMANTVCGTPYYFSPELCRNKPYNNKSDIWALGVLLYECATGGRHPFDGNSMNQLMQRIVKGNYAPLSSKYSAEFRKMVDWCLQKDPAKRPSIKQLLAYPLLRDSLEQLEQNLMLATQCKIRLKDIIDFEGDLEHRSEEPAKPTTPAAAKNAYPGMSPGQAAAMAMAKQMTPAAPSSPQKQAAVGPKPGGMHGGGANDFYSQQQRLVMERLRQQQQLSPQRAQGRTPSLAAGSPAPTERKAEPARPGADLAHDNQRNNVNFGQDPRQMRREDPQERANRYDADVKRVDAIIAKYGKNVDPKAKETIHAFMRRKQDEYMQRQKDELERRERRNDLRQKELQRVLDQQRNLANNANNANNNNNRPLSPQRSPRNGVADVRPVSPRAQTPTSSDNVRPTSPGRGGAAFGRDPRSGRAPSAGLQPPYGKKMGVAANSPGLRYDQLAPPSPSSAAAKGAGDRRPFSQPAARADQDPSSGRLSDQRNRIGSEALLAAGVGAYAPPPNDRLKMLREMQEKERALAAQRREQALEAQRARTPELKPSPPPPAGLAGVSPRYRAGLSPRSKGKSPYAPPALNSQDVLETGGQQSPSGNNNVSPRHMGDLKYQQQQQQQRQGQGRGQPLEPLGYAAPPSSESPTRGALGRLGALPPVRQGSAQAASRESLSPSREAARPKTEQNVISAHLRRSNELAADQLRRQNGMSPERAARAGAAAEGTGNVPSMLDSLRNLRNEKDKKDGAAWEGVPDQLALLKQRQSLKPIVSPPPTGPRAPNARQQPSKLVPSLDAITPPTSPTRGSGVSPMRSRSKSVDGYSEMLQHLKDLLQKRKISHESKIPAPPSPSAMVPEEKGPDVASPPHLHYTKPNGKVPPLDIPDNNSDTRDDDEDDDDFEDAVPLSPVRCTELNDTYTRKKMAEQQQGPPKQDEKKNVYSEDVFLQGAGEEEELDDDGYTGYYQV